MKSIEFINEGPKMDFVKNATKNLAKSAIQSMHAAGYGTPEQVSRARAFKNIQGIERESRNYFIANFISAFNSRFKVIKESCENFEQFDILIENAIYLINENSTDEVKDWIIYYVKNKVLAAYPVIPSDTNNKLATIAENFQTEYSKTQQIPKEQLESIFKLVWNITMLQPRDRDGKIIYSTSYNTNSTDTSGTLGEITIPDTNSPIVLKKVGTEWKKADDTVISDATAINYLNKLDTGEIQWNRLDAIQRAGLKNMLGI